MGNKTSSDRDNQYNHDEQHQQDEQQQQQQQQQQHSISKPNVYTQNLNEFGALDIFKDRDRVGECYFIKIPLACTKVLDLPSNFNHYAVLIDICGESDNDRVVGLLVHMILVAESEGMVHLQLARMDKPIDNIFFIQKMGKLLQQQTNSDNNNNNNNTLLQTPNDYLNFVSKESTSIFESFFNNNRNNHNNRGDSSGVGGSDQSLTKKDISNECDDGQPNKINKLINNTNNNDNYYWSSHTNSQKFAHHLCNHFGFDPSGMTQGDVGPPEISQIDPSLFKDLAQ
ncbi:hypothetical protein CYY_009931 [Polysphondylium violaceum]|uniref:Uncharacterized protein n=1 Tax=Polysphondylium violaceum TaxID=133409 RepID=A0A8J4PKY8_9MYCE|nr:hypothetical protein CYY_009931 [Polysphondylium violaceum]